jgi:phage FluMu gp28-like protein
MAAAKKAPPQPALDVFLKYQQLLMSTVSCEAVTVVEKSRRTGYSWAIAAEAGLTAAADKAAGGMDVFYVGYNLEMAREFIDYVADWSKQLAPGAVAVEETFFTDPEHPDKQIKAFRVEFASGFKVLALPSMPRSLRGMQGMVIIDEAAFHDELEELLTAAFALLIWGGRVVVISTHNGDANPFNTLVNDIRAGRKPYKLLRCTFDDALADGLYKRICFTKGETWTPAKEKAWRASIIAFYGDGADEELGCIPSEGSGTYLPLAILEKCMEPGIPVVLYKCDSSFAQLSDHIRDAECADWCERVLLPLLRVIDPELRSVFGQDFGRTGDLSVIWPLLIQKNLRMRTPFVVEMRNVPFRQQEQILYYVGDRLPRLQAGALDARGNGQYQAERAMQHWGANRIAMVMPTVEWYRDNMPRYKAAFEDQMIIIPEDANVLADHRIIVMVKGVARVPERTKGNDGGKRHGDSAIAGALAVFASRMDVLEYGYISAKSLPPEMRDEFDDDDAGGSGELRFKDGCY